MVDVVERRRRVFGLAHPSTFAAERGLDAVRGRLGRSIGSLRVAAAFAALGVMTAMLWRNTTSQRAGKFF